MQNRVVIVDLFKNIVEQTAIRWHTDKDSIRYDYGTRIEMDNTLAEASQNQAASAKKFPLIALILPFEEDTPGNIRGENLVDVSLTLIIAAISQQNLKAAARYTANFKPTLYPIHDHLLHVISRCGYFKETDENAISRTAIDYPYYSGENNGQANVFSDLVDCIIIKNLKLTVKPYNC